MCMENTGDTQREAWIDRRVQRALRTDSRSIYAANATEEASAEADTTAEAEAAADELFGARA